jgi:hypothetical protein
VCCGKNRTILSQTRTSPATRRATQPSPAFTRRQPSYVAYFEYTGKASMTVVGPVSGMWYRFAAPRSRVAVDPRDRSALMAVPGLVQVQGT